MPDPLLFEETFLRRLEQLAVLCRRAVAGRFQGERRSSKRGQSVEFADFRPYTMGDDFRRIDWNAYARLERFFIKLFVEEQDLTVHLLLDTSRSMDWGEPNKLHYARRAAAALGYITLVGLDRVTVAASGGPHFAPHRGKQQALTLFSFLQACAASPPAHLAAWLRSYAAATVQPGPALLFSDLLDAGWADGLRALAGRGLQVTVLHILSPDEINPSLAGDLWLLDVEDEADSPARRHVEITADFDLIQRYRDGLADWRQEIKKFCDARGMNYVSVDTSLPFDDLLFAVLRQQGVLK